MDDRILPEDFLWNVEKDEIEDTVSDLKDDIKTRDIRLLRAGDSA